MIPLFLKNGIDGVIVSNQSKGQSIKDQISIIQKIKSVDKQGKLIVVA